MASELKRVGGLWLGTGKKGQYLSGVMDEDIPSGCRLFVFRNHNKKTDKSPDYSLLIADESPQHEPAARTTAPAVAVVDDCDIPF